MAATTVKQTDRHSCRLFVFFVLGLLLPSCVVRADVPASSVGARGPATNNNASDAANPDLIRADAENEFRRADTDKDTYLSKAEFVSWREQDVKVQIGKGDLIDFHGRQPHAIPQEFRNF